MQKLHTDALYLEKRRKTTHINHIDHTTILRNVWGLSEHDRLA